ncbi:MAG: lasso peptide biosynthesis protein [Acidobacteriota bacterium]
MADRLRSVPPWRPSYLANPRYLEGSADRLTPLLPPRGFGHCLKHSFLLLDLWSRCGLEPRIHIGTLKRDGEQRFHAWVTLPGTERPGAADEFVEIWSH